MKISKSSITKSFATFGELKKYLSWCPFCSASRKFTSSLFLSNQDYDHCLGATIIEHSIFLEVKTSYIAIKWQYDANWCEIEVFDSASKILINDQFILETLFRGKCDSCQFETCTELMSPLSFQKEKNASGFRFYISDEYLVLPDKTELSISYLRQSFNAKKGPQNINMFMKPLFLLESILDFSNVEKFYNRFKNRIRTVQLFE